MFLLAGSLPEGCEPLLLLPASVGGSQDNDAEELSNIPSGQVGKCREPMGRRVGRVWALQGLALAQVCEEAPAQLARVLAERLQRSVSGGTCLQPQPPGQR